MRLIYTFICTATFLLNPAGVRDDLGELDTLSLTGQYEQALEQIAKHEQNGTPDDSLLTAKGQVLIEVGRYEDAIDCFKLAVKRNPRNTTARRLLGETYEIIGDKENAVRTYDWFVQLLERSYPASAVSLTDSAVAVYRHAVLTRRSDLVRRTRYVLQDLLQIAYERVDPKYWPARMAAADLLLSKYNLIDAAEDYEEALKINDQLADAHVGLGCIALAGWKFEATEEKLAAALEINPNSTAAYCLRAQLCMTERKYGPAADAAKRALDVNPNHMEALSLLAAARMRDGDKEGSKNAIEKANKLNPQSPILPATLGAWLSAGRQYEDAEAQFKKAIELAPDWPDPHTALGLMYMQSGHEREARRVLETSWKLDPYNAKTKHTLDLLDDLERFSRDETENFIVKSKDDRDAAIRPYIAAYLESIYDEITTKFGGPPEHKTIVELFPDHQSFAVRITGNPWIHTIGACTGPVIAMDAPRADVSPTRFNWADVLRHEYVHTVTLTATGNRIPHWFTEGLACWTEKSPRKWEMCRILAMALRTDMLFDLKTIDWGFFRPKKHTDRTLAYAQSEWMVEYIIERFGFDVIGGMLQEFKNHKTQDQAFEQVLKLSPAEFMTDFKPWAVKQVQSWNLPTSPVASADEIKRRLKKAEGEMAAVLRAQLAQTLLMDHEIDEAEQQIDKAIEAEDNHPEVLRVYITIKAIKRKAENEESKRSGMLKDLAARAETLAELDPNSGLAARVLGIAAIEAKDHDEAVKHFIRLKQIWPADRLAYRKLMEIHLERDEPDKALPEMVELANLANDNLFVVTKIADIYTEQNQPQDATRWLKRAIEIDPYAVSIHKRLGELLMRENSFDEAIEEFEVLVRIQPGEANHHSQLAFALHRAGQKEKARATAQRAVTLDPDNEARKLLD
jgi:tetratricopeptide (TPR) repeat protein